MKRPAATLLALPLVLAACVSQARPATCDEPAATIQLTLSPDALSPKNPAVCRDQDVTLVVDSEMDGTLHIHGYDADVPATAVTAGEEVRLEFTASRAGQFPIEIHTDAAPQGMTVGLFTVHEP